MGRHLSCSFGVGYIGAVFDFVWETGSSPGARILSYQAEEVLSSFTVAFGTLMIVVLVGARVPTSAIGKRRQRRIGLVTRAR